MASVEMTLKVLDALSATNDEGFRAAVHGLPVAITTVASKDRYGRSGVLKSYQVRGKLRLRQFTVDPGEILATESRATLARSGSESVMLEKGAGGGPVAGAQIDDCWDDVNQVYDVCATEEEIDEALTMVLASEVEAQDMVSEFGDETAEFETWCVENPELCAPPPSRATALEWVDLNPFNFEPRPDALTESDGPFWTDAARPSEDNEIPHPCTDAVVDAVYGAGAAALVIYEKKAELRAAAVLVRALTPLAASASVWIGVGVAAFAVVGLRILTYRAVRCFRELK
jgi:hypothetical protein